jgi:uncharacterized protein YbjT (DUF2867 family)
MLYAIMGATGNVGGKIADILLKNREKVRALSRSMDKLIPLKDRGAEAHAGDAADPVFLTRAFNGADAVFVLIPPNMKALDFRAYQNKFGDSIAQAIRSSGVKYVVNLSSIGAELSDGNGPIKGLYDQEQRLSTIEKVNILHLRPANFMENLFTNIDLIKSKGIMGGPIRGDLKMAMIATKDIATVAADYLIKRNFFGKSVKELLGQRDLTMEEAAKVIGWKLGKPDLPYVTFSYEDAYNGMVAAGLSEDLSRLYVEMSKGLNDGLFGISKVRRTPENTTDTSIEEFADYFAQVYRTAIDGKAA